MHSSTKHEDSTDVIRDDLVVGRSSIVVKEEEDAEVPLSPTLESDLQYVLKSTQPNPTQSITYTAWRTWTYSD